MSINAKKESKTLIFSSLVGVCVAASYQTIFNSAIVSFSLFPIIALILSAYCLYQRYQEASMPEGMASLTAVFCLLGFLVYNVFIRSQYPELGNNLLQTFIALGLMGWVTYKFKAIEKQPALESAGDKVEQ